MGPNWRKVPTKSNSEICGLDRVAGTTDLSRKRCPQLAMGAYDASSLLTSIANTMLAVVRTASLASRDILMLLFAYTRALKVRRVGWLRQAS